MAAYAALGHGAMDVGDVLQRFDRMHSPRQLSGRGALEQRAQPTAVRVGNDGAHGDATLGGGLAARLNADEHSAVTNQCEALLLQHRPVGNRVPARLGPSGEVGTEAPDSTGSPTSGSR